MKSNYRKGSMGAADEKSERRWFIGASIVVGIIYLLFFFPLFGNYFHLYFVRAGIAWKVLGIISGAGWYWFMWSKSARMITSPGDRGTPALILFLWLALNICLMSGWNFDLDGIE